VSTILQAQQKNKLEQAGGPPPIIQKSTNIQLWKVLLGIALTTIIALLSILIYLLLNPRPLAPTAQTVEKPPTVQETRQLLKVSFETEPLTMIVPVITATQQKPTTVAKKEVTQEVGEVKQPLPSPSKKEEQQEVVIEQTREQQQSAEELKKRFDLAVLMTEIDENELQTDYIDDENSDGSDIRQMNSDFQNKVPLIRYDSHMYSTIAADRWIRINGETLKEGDVDSSGKLELLEIQPQRSIFRLDRQSFSLESLVDWKGY
jgi:general secretion pathway protein B